MSFFKKIFARRATEDSPQRDASPQRSADAVRFVREKQQELRVQDGLDTVTIKRVYRIHKGPDESSALAFLATHPVTRMHEYLIVETPEGNYGRDISGIFDESTGDPIDSSKVANFEYGTLVVYAPRNLTRGLWLQTEVKAEAVIQRGRRPLVWTTEFRPIAPKGKVIAAVFPFLKVGQYEVRLPAVPDVGGGESLNATVDSGMVTELKPYG